MKITYTLLGILLLTSCAHSSSTYLGNGLYSVEAHGGGAVSESAVQSALVKEAYTICAKDGKGFQIQGMQDTSKTGAYINGNMVSPVNNPGNRALIKCEGEIDPILQKQYSKQASVN